MKKAVVTRVIEEKNFTANTLFLGDRKMLLESVREQAKKYFENLDVFNKIEVDIFEVEKLNLPVDDIRRMISFVNKTSENKKLVFLSSFYWSPESQNAMLKILEETPPNTYIYIFGLSEKSFLPTVLSRVQKSVYKNTNRYLDLAQEILELQPNHRPDNPKVKKILNLKTVDFNYEKNTENEKKDREAHILFLRALIETIIDNREDMELSKTFLDQLLKITVISEIEGGSPHLFIDWLLLAAPKVPGK